MKIYKHSFDHISIDGNISLFDIDIDFYIKDDMDLSITIQDIGMILLHGIEYDSIDHKALFNKLEEYYRNNETLDIVRSNHYADLLDLIKEEALEYAV